LFFDQLDRGRVVVAEQFRQGFLVGYHVGTNKDGFAPIASGDLVSQDDQGAIRISTA
jgi:hypothetical protein